MTENEKRMLFYIREMGKRIAEARAVNNAAVDSWIADPTTKVPKQIVQEYRKLRLDFIDEQVIVAFSQGEDIVLTRLQAEENGSYRKTN